jgi:hypothetical protein
LTTPGPPFSESARSKLIVAREVDAGRRWSHGTRTPSSSPPISARASLQLSHRAGEVNRKTDQIRAAWAAGDQIRALRIAARFFDRSVDTKIFKRGMDAYNNPGFYRQIGKEPAQLTAAALELMAKKFSL